MSDNLITARLEGVKLRFEEIGQMITDPAVIGDMKRYIQLNKEYRHLEPIVESYNAYKNLVSNLENARTILSEEKDEEMREMAKAEIEELSEQERNNFV